MIQRFYSFVTEQSTTQNEKIRHRLTDAENEMEKRELQFNRSRRIRVCTGIAIVLLQSKLYLSYGPLCFHFMTSIVSKYINDKRIIYLKCKIKDSENPL